MSRPLRHPATRNSPGLLADRFSGRALLTAGLAITVAGNLLFWVVVRSQLSYSLLVAGMLVAVAGAALLNGQPVKVLSSAVPPDRAGYILGDDLTAAVQLSFVGELAAARFGIAEYPNTDAWIKRFQARPAYQAALARGGIYSFAS